MHSRKTIILHASIGLILIGISIYVLLEKKLFIGGKLTGHIFEFNYPANIIMATSFFLEAIFSITTLIEGKLMKRANEMILISALILFVIGAFI